MLVYILNKEGQPLMPCSCRSARLLLRQGKAKVIKRTPFTIQLLFGSSGHKQEIVLGVDAGSKMIGLSATSEKEELFSGEMELRNNIVDLLSTKRQNRKARRSRLRYRKPRFLNRIKSKNKEWMAPSIRHKIQSHISIIEKMHKILPITKIVVEVASFDIQKLNNPDIQGIGYQQGSKLGFWNTRQYVLHRDGYKCHGKNGCKNNIFNVHHIESRKTGGNAQDNLITLCKECHRDYHSGKLKLNLIRGESFRDASFMGIMRWSLYNKLKFSYTNVNLTYGYITKNNRIANNLPKEHKIDALCITGKPMVKQSCDYYFIKQVRKHNRQIHKANILKKGRKKLNQAPYLVKGFRLFDKVKFKNREYFIFGRRKSGFFDIRDLTGNKINKGSVNFKHLELLESRGSLLWEKRPC